MAVIFHNSFNSLFNSKIFLQYFSNTAYISSLANRSKAITLQIHCEALTREKKNFEHPLFTQSRTIKSYFGKEFGKYDLIKRPGKLSETRTIPSHIITPQYYPHGQPVQSDDCINIRNKSQIKAMKKAGRIARQVMNAIGEKIEVGVTTDYLDRIGHETAISLNSFPSPLKYKGYPKSICTSVNNVACHGIPDDRPLQFGDIVSVDVTVYHDSHHGDCCETFCLPETDDEGLRLVSVARHARDEAIKLCGPGVPMTIIGKTCEEIALEAGYSVVPIFIGHGIGENFHELPEVYHFDNTGSEIMEEGMTFTIEPIVSQGSEDIAILKDGWTAVLTDNGRAAQFEHTILITDDGHQILTE